MKSFTPTSTVFIKFDRAFTLVELMVSVTIMAVIMTFFGTIVGAIQGAWGDSTKRAESFQNARAALELMGRELAPAVVDTRMQFAVVAGHDYLAGTSASSSPAVAAFAKGMGSEPSSPSLFWMAPLGPSGELRLVGYYLSWDGTRHHYRLKRVFVSPDNVNKFFPKVSTEEYASYDQRNKPDPSHIEWLINGLTDSATNATKAFDDNDPANLEAVVSTAIDNVVGLYVQCIDRSGNPIPWASENTVQPTSYAGRHIIYNSAQFFIESQSANPNSTDTFWYLDPMEEPSAGEMKPFALRGNKVPAAIELTIITLDSGALQRIAPGAVPLQRTILNGDKALDLEASLKAFNKDLQDAGIDSARRFTTRINMVNG